MPHPTSVNPIGTSRRRRPISPAATADAPTINGVLLNVSPGPAHQRAIHDGTGHQDEPSDPIDHAAGRRERPERRVVDESPRVGTC